MAYKLSTFLTQVNELTSEDAQENNGLAAAQRYRCVRLAVQQYSQDRPDLYIKDVSGADTYYYAMSNLTSWVEGFSSVQAIEYPAADLSADETPQYLDRDQWVDDYWQDVSGTQTRYVRFIDVQPATGDEFRATYTIPYAWAASAATTAVAQTAHGFSVGDYLYYDTANSVYVEASDTILSSHIVTAKADVDNFTVAILQTTIPAGDFMAVCYLAACITCREIAARYSRIGSSTINVDSGAHITKAQNFEARAKTYCIEYANLLGLALGDTAQERPAQAFVELDTRPAWQCGRRYMFHNRGCR